VELAKLLKGTQRPYLDVVIDSAGGDIVSQTSKLLKSGGKFVCYGMYGFRPVPVLSSSKRQLLGRRHLRSHLR
jgi:NADPH:quinone reductase-like Zn-dependent oxidoreductase